MLFLTKTKKKGGKMTKKQEKMTWKQFKQESSCLTCVFFDQSKAKRSGTFYGERSKQNKKLSNERKYNKEGLCRYYPATLYPIVKIFANEWCSKHAIETEYINK
jgi:hypothetical protein